VTKFHSHQYNLDLWLRVMKEYTEPLHKALNYFVLFPKTYICIHAFIQLFHTKPECNNRMNAVVALKPTILTEIFCGFPQIL
jgi:hypothetical protein